MNDASAYDRMYAPYVTVSPYGTMVAVWRDSRAGDDVSDIYMATSTNYGAGWSANRRVDHAPDGYQADFPALVVNDAGNLFVIWHDNRDGDWDIYLTNAGTP